MINITNKSFCCGCSACIGRCPKSCITMHEDNEGFLYPIVDMNQCTDCGLCERVCPIINQSFSRKPISVFAAKNPNEEIKKRSSSGGIFTMIAEKIIKNNGVVFGARFNELWDVVHDYAETIEGLENFRGSKYVQSQMGDNYKKAEEFLKLGRTVLFSGTSCQIAGLKKFLKKDYQNLVTIDVVCHGVPSPKLWRNYLGDFLFQNVTERKNTDLKSLKTSSIKTISFRDKRIGWKKYGFAVKYSSLQQEEENTDSQSCTVKELFEEHSENDYMKAFLRDMSLRYSCYNCCAKDGKSQSDISLADYWGISKYYPDFADDNGISLVLVYSEKGLNLLERIKYDFINTKYEHAILGNLSIKYSVSMPKYRLQFFDFVSNSTLGEAINELTKPSLKQKLRAFIGVITSRISVIAKIKYRIKKWIIVR